MKTKLVNYLILVIFLFTSVSLSSVQAAGTKVKKTDPRFYVIGMGPGAADLITLRTITYLKKSDVIFCRKETADKYKKYLKGKKIVSLPMFSYWECLQKNCHNPGPADKEICKKLVKKRAERAGIIRKYIKEGKKVALLEGGDPSIFGSLRWIKQEFTDDEFEVVPGISSFNVANALLKREVVDAYVADWQTRTVILTTPTREGNRKDSIENLAKIRSTMVFFMPREFEEKILPQLKKHYPHDTPVAVVFSAGDQGKEQVIRGTIGNFPVQPPEKRWLRLIYVGEFLKDALKLK